jgi:MFS family permease
MSTSTADSSYAWARLAAALALGGFGGVGMWSVAVVLPAVQAEFGVDRGAASFPYAMTMLGIACGGIAMGKLLDLRGIRFVILLGIIGLGVGFTAAANVTSLSQFVLVQGLIIGGLGGAASFAPLVADISLWFVKRRGLAVALCASGNYLAGAIWPPLIQYGVTNYGWRTTYLAVAVICVIGMLPLLLMFRRTPPLEAAKAVTSDSVSATRPLGHNPKFLQSLLMLAGVACCVGMSMPQVHIVAYCGDLGYGLQRGAEMLSIMLAFGIVSRLISGWICDHIGGLATLLLGSTLQSIMLLAYLPFDSLTALYIVSAMFGLAQGGIVPSYAIVVRDLFPAAEAGTRVSAVLMSTVAGMALGGWLSGLIFDYTGSYRAAFLHGVAWNLLNIAIALYLFTKRYPRRSKLVTA